MTEAEKCNTISADRAARRALIKRRPVVIAIDGNEFTACLSKVNMRYPMGLLDLELILALPAKRDRRKQ